MVEFLYYPITNQIILCPFDKAYFNEDPICFSFRTLESANHHNNLKLFPQSLL